jgi:hypothetical protein
MLRTAEVPKAQRRKANYSTEGSTYVMEIPKAWVAGGDLSSWVFQLGLVANNTAGADTNIPGRSH